MLCSSGPVPRLSVTNRDQQSDQAPEETGKLTLPKQVIVILLGEVHPRLQVQRSYCPGGRLTQPHRGEAGGSDKGQNTGFLQRD